MAGITTYLSILTLKVNGLSIPIKWHCLANWIKKEDLTICWLRPILLTEINNALGCRLEDLPSQWPTKRAGVAILLSDKVDFKLTLVKWDKKGHFILIKRAIHQKEITIIKLYAPNISVPNFIKHTLKDIKAHTDSNSVVVGDINTLYH
jgi:hypothetical protein